MAGTGARTRRSAIDILEEAVHLLRQDTLKLAPYYIGTLPFVLGLIYFWADMGTSAGAWRHSSQAAWALSLLFVWMKTWQTVYGSSLLSGIRGSAPGRWNGSRVFRTLLAQTAIQPWGIIFLPIALLITLPFPRTLAFFQNVTLLGSGEDRELGSVIRKSWHQSALWPMQNALLVWLGSPFLVVFGALLLFAVVPAIAAYMPGIPLLGLLLPAGLVMICASPLATVVALNIGLSMFFAPHLLRLLSGIETALTRSNAWAKNDAFFLVVCCLVYLCLDPLLKACYCLRCFYGASIETGRISRWS